MYFFFFFHGFRSTYRFFRSAYLFSPQSSSEVYFLIVFFILIFNSSAVFILYQIVFFFLRFIIILVEHLLSIQAFFFSYLSLCIYFTLSRSIVYFDHQSWIWILTTVIVPPTMSFLLTENLFWNLSSDCAVLLPLVSLLCLALKDVKR